MSDPSEMQIATLTVVRQADVGWAKQLGEETTQFNVLVEIRVSFLIKTRHLTV
jgi:hypothetical protein